MSKFWQYVLRFGPLVAAFALGLSAFVEVWVPGFTGILNNILSVLSFVGIKPDTAVIVEIANLVAGITALVGVARKLWALVKPYFNPEV